MAKSEDRTGANTQPSPGAVAGNDRDDDALATRRAKRLAGLDEAFGALKRRSDIPDSVIYQRKLRNEW